MDFLDNINTDTIILCNNYLKNKILEYLSNKSKLYPIKIMSQEEFLSHYFFNYTKETICYLIKKYNLSYKNAKLYLNNMKYIINTNLNNKKINNLKTIYKDLIDHNKLIFDNYFQNVLKKNNLIVLNEYYLDSFTKSILGKFNTKYLNIEEDLELKSIYKFNTIEEECEFVFNKICELLKQNIDINDIKISLLGPEYKIIIKRFSNIYHIPVNNLEKISIISSIEANTFLKMLKENTKEEIFNYLNEINYLELINLLNEYYFASDFSLVLDEIKEDLKNIYYDETYEGIEIVDFENLSIYKDKYVFILGFNLENIPKTYKDIDFLNDKEKNKLGLLTSLEKNIVSHDLAIKIIKSLNNLYISYKEQDAYNKYLESNLIKELYLNKEMIELENMTSNLYNQIKLTNYLDILSKYNIKDKSLNLLYSTYPNIPYLNFSNKFTGINNLNNNISLSYTSLNDYYHCSFRFYIDYILKLNIFEETFSLHIGTIFHYVLSKIFDNNFDFKKTWLESLEKYTFSKKEEIYLEDLKEELKKIIELIKHQHKLTGLNNTKLEQTITISYDNNKFTGVIDKIMFKEKDGKTYISLVDYKTGSLKINLNNLQYGLDMQLPIYVYLVKNSNLFKNPEIVGFYLQQILFEKEKNDDNKDEFEIKKDKLKLNGYTIKDEYLISVFDSSYQSSEMIKGMRTTSKGFSSNAKLLSSDEIDNMASLVDNKIKDAFKEICNSNFSINPKIINGKNIGCNYCKYQDLCYKTGNDLVYLNNHQEVLDV